MSKKILTPIFIFSILFSIVSLTVKAQEVNNNLDSAAQIKQEKKIAVYKNIIKVNLIAILLKNYAFQYERVINRKFSFAIQYRTMPTTGLPFKSAILKAVGDDPDTKKTIGDLQLSNYAITPEIRFYVSKKGYGRGFYIAPFYRYASFTTNQVNIFYDDDAGNQASMKLSGKVTANTGGILFGVQHGWGKHIVIDSWILGPHYGSGKGDFRGVSSKPLSQKEQDDIRDQINSIDIPVIKKTVDVNANGASVKLDGPWGGFRVGLSLGYKF